jgi:hypothetical protein
MFTSSPGIVPSQETTFLTHEQEGIPHLFVFSAITEVKSHF